MSSSAAVRPLTPGERGAAYVIAVLVAILGVIGLVNSFHAVAVAAAPVFGSLAWTVPAGIDLGLAAFAALDLLLARLDMRPRWLRLVPWALIAVTIYLNVSPQQTAFGVVAHAVLPSLWVVAVEVGIHAVRVRAGLAAGTRIESIRASRWLLAPVSTLLLWRRMVLWEVRSYSSALERERDRVLARTELQDTYGPIGWRWRAPRRKRALYRLGELAPASTGVGHHPGDPLDASRGLDSATRTTVQPSNPVGEQPVSNPVPGSWPGTGWTAPAGRASAAMDTDPSTVVGGWPVPLSAGFDVFGQPSMPPVGVAGGGGFSRPGAPAGSVAAPGSDAAAPASGVEASAGGGAGRSEMPREAATAAALAVQETTGQLPSVRQLQELASVSRGTAQNALKALREQRPSLQLIQPTDS